jgi:hypothetical protein
VKLRLSLLAVVCFCLAQSLSAQNSSSAAAPQAVQVPHLVKFSGTVQGAAADSGAGGIILGTNVAPTNVVAVTFSLYAEQTGGVPLWSEVQNVHVNAAGQYNVQLGSTKPDGLPMELFASAQAQWLGVQVQGQPEQSRVMLLSVPYALKAADAETFGGKPPSAYIQSTEAATTNGSTAAAAANPAGGPARSVQNGHPLILTGSGTPNFIPVWTSASSLASSNLWQGSNGWLTWGDQTPIAPLAIVSSARGALVVEGVTGNTFPIIEASAQDPTSASPVIEAISNSNNSNGMAVYGIAQNTAASNVAVEGVNNSSNGTAVLGNANATSGLTVGVSGQVASPAGAGVIGINTATTGNGPGVNGQAFSAAATAVLGHNKSTTGGPSLGAMGITDSTGGIGTYGTGVSPSDEGAGITFRPIGVWGDTNQSAGVGVLATTDFGIAIAAYNNAENISTVKFQNDEATDEVGNVLATKGGHFGGICVMDVGGNLGCTGSKSAVVPVDGGTRKVALYAVEAPENWFEDFGTGQLSRGSAVVQLDSTFSQTINSSDEYHVFLTPKGDCKGLYVTNETADSFEVRELGGGTASVAFDYRIIARRKGYESVRLADKTKQFENAANQPAPGSVKLAPVKLPQTKFPGMNSPAQLALGTEHK